MKVELVCSMSPIPEVQGAGRDYMEGTSRRGKGECWGNSCCLGLEQVPLLRFLYNGMTVVTFSWGCVRKK